MSDIFRPHGLQPTRLLCPWGFQARVLEWVAIAFSVWYMYTMEYYSVIKRNTFESVLMRWMNPEPIIQSEVSQKYKCKYLMHI